MYECKCTYFNGSMQHGVIMLPSKNQRPSEENPSMGHGKPFFDLSIRGSRKPPKQPRPLALPLGASQNLVIRPYY